MQNRPDRKPRPLAQCLDRCVLRSVDRCVLRSWVQPRAWFVACLGLMLAACGTAPPVARGGPTPMSQPAPADAPAKPGPLAAEQQWLADLFKGTPVQVMAERGGAAVRLEVPLRYAFDGGSSQPKPPLQAVLQRLGQSLARHPGTRLALAAPGPGAAERQQAMREQLIAMGLPAHRVSASLTTPGSPNAVSLRLAVAASAIQRLNDRDLPVLPAASVTAPASR